MAVPKWAVSADSLSATGLTGSAYAAPVQSSARMEIRLAIVLSIVARLGRNAGLSVIKHFGGKTKVLISATAQAVAGPAGRPWACRRDV